MEKAKAEKIHLKWGQVQLPFNSISKHKYPTLLVFIRIFIMSHTTIRTLCSMPTAHSANADLQLNKSSVEIQSFISVSHANTSYPVQHPLSKASAGAQLLASMVLKRKVCAHERRVIFITIQSILLYILHTHAQYNCCSSKLIAYPPACLSLKLVIHAM